MFDKFVPKFVKQFAKLDEPLKQGMSDYVKSVKSQQFPDPEAHGFLVGEDTKRAIKSQLATYQRRNYSTRTQIEEPFRVAIIGGGALGSLFASRLSMIPPNLLQVYFVSSWNEQLDCVRQNGLILTASNDGLPTSKSVNIHAVLHGSDQDGYQKCFEP